MSRKDVKDMDASAVHKFMSTLERKMRKVRHSTPQLALPDDEDGESVIGHKLWSSADKRTYFSVADTVDELPPDVYEPKVTNTGQPFFYRIHFSTEELLRFEDSNIDRVVSEITEFWKRRDRFEEFEFPYRRGILLHGPPGSGKSCAVKLIINDVIEKGGIGLRFDDPGIFIRCMRNFRLVQPETPVIGIMEDLDGIMDRYDESTILNMLDGIDGFENIVYLATTNYPEDLEGRIKNRPSRFDRRFEIGFPNPKSRRQYIHYLVKKVATAEALVDVDRWVDDTHEFTLAHIKELFISVILFETEYDAALKTLQEMRKKISSDDYGGDRRPGFFRED
jgi:hypothetical protein